MISIPLCSEHHLPGSKSMHHTAEDILVSLIDMSYAYENQEHAWASISSNFSRGRPASRFCSATQAFSFFMGLPQSMISAAFSMPSLRSEA